MGGHVDPPIRINMDKNTSKNGNIRLNVKGRASQGAGVFLSKGTLGWLARRGDDFGTTLATAPIETLARIAAVSPFDLIIRLPDLSPEVGQALWNALRLGCAPGTVRIKAMTLGGETIADDESDPGDLPQVQSGKSEEDPYGSLKIKELFDNQPEEVGSFDDCLSKNFQMLMLTGMCATEAVPAPRGKGVSAVYPVNSLSLRFKREDSGQLMLYQKQAMSSNGFNIFQDAGLGGVYEPMPMERFFYSSVDGLPDEPYGRSPYGPVLTAFLECAVFLRSLDLAFHRIGMPKINVGLDYKGWAETATQIVGVTDPKEIDEWCITKQQEVIELFSNMEPDDAFFHGTGDLVNTVGAGDKMPDIPGIWALKQARLIEALKTTPALAGIVSGSTETWASVDWKIYTAGLTSIVFKSALPLVRAANLHLRLLGLPLRAELEMEPIRAEQAQLDAQTEAMKIRNEAAKRDQGWQTQDEAAMAVTGSAAVGDPARLNQQNGANENDGDSGETKAKGQPLDKN